MIHETPNRSHRFLLSCGHEPFPAPARGELRSGQARCSGMRENHDTDRSFRLGSSIVQAGATASLRPCPLTLRLLYRMVRTYTHTPMRLYGQRSALLGPQQERVAPDVSYCRDRSPYRAEAGASGRHAERNQNVRLDRGVVD
jgi:hypothetical protein